MIAWLFWWHSKGEKSLCSGLLWRCSGWESACQYRGHEFEPWSGKIPHAAEQLGPCATTTEPVLYSPWATPTEPARCNYWSSRACSPCSVTRKATAVRGPRTAMKGGPQSPKLERALAQQWRPNSVQKKKERKRSLCFGISELASVFQLYDLG